MVLPIYVFGHPILRKKATSIDMNYPELQTLLSDMFETMYQDQGVGLAAPQIGKSIRIDVEIFKGVFINPVMVEEFGDDFVFSEGCLSLPDIHEEVTRKSEIRISFTDENGVEKTEHFKGLVARIIQHEYDHLEGRVFTDKLTSLKKMILKRKLTDIANGKSNANYKTKNK